MSFVVEVERPRDAKTLAIIKLKGELDQSSLTGLQDHLQLLCREKVKHFVIDGSMMPKIQTNALGKLVELVKGEFSNYSLLFCSLQSQVVEMIEERDPDCLKVFSNQQECLDNLRSKIKISKSLYNKISPEAVEMTSETISLPSPSLEPELVEEPKNTIEIINTTEKVEDLKCLFLLRHYRRMSLNKMFPLNIIVAQENSRSKLKNIPKTTGPDSIEVSKENSVMIVPRVPGAIVVPDYALVDPTDEISEASFWVTPLSLGNSDGWVEIWRNDEKLHNIPMNSKIKAPKLAKWSAIFGVAIAGIFSLLEEHGIDLREYLDEFEVAKYLEQYQAYYPYTGAILGGVFLLLAVFFYWRARPKRSKIAEHFVQLGDKE